MVFILNLFFLVPQNAKAIPVEDSGSYVNQMLDYTLKYQYFYTTDAPSQWGQWAEGIVSAYNAVENTVHNKLIELKEFVFDGLAWTAANVIIDKFADSLVVWIQNGFEGSPMFLSDPEGFFKDTANDISGAIINDLNMNWLCDSLGKFRFDLAFFLPGTSRSQYACTFEDIANNFKDTASRDSLGDWIDVNVNVSQQNIVRRFGDDFRNGGFWMWLATADPKNNQLGRTLTTANSVYAVSEQAKNRERFGLSINGGFFGMRKCVERASVPMEPGQKAPCARYVNTTPGGLVQDQLNNAANKDLARLQVADEIDEIIGALVTTLMGWVLTGGNNNGGVLGYDSNDESYAGSKRDHYGELSKGQKATKTKSNISGQIETVKSSEEQYSDSLNDYADALYGTKEKLQTTLAKLECIYATSTSDMTYDYASCDDDIESIGKNLSVIDKTSNNVSDDITNVKSGISNINNKINTFNDTYGVNATTTSATVLGLLDSFENEVAQATSQSEISGIEMDYCYEYDKTSKTAKICGLFGDKSGNSEMAVDIISEKNPATINSVGNIVTKIYWKAINAESCVTTGGENAWKKIEIGNSGSYTTPSFSDGESRTYGIKCTDEKNKRLEAEVSVSGENSSTSNAGATANIFANPQVVKSDNASNVYWLSSNANSCYLYSDKDSLDDGGLADSADDLGGASEFYIGSGYYLNVDNNSTKGRATTELSEETTYKLICKGLGGDIADVSEIKISTMETSKENYQTHNDKDFKKINKESGKIQGKTETIALKYACLLDEYTSKEDVTKSECNTVKESSQSASSQ